MEYQLFKEAEGNYAVKRVLGRVRQVDPFSNLKL